MNTFTIDFGKWDREDKDRRWRACFGKEGACTQCNGIGLTCRSEHRICDGVDCMRECFHCLGTGRGDHERKP